MTNPYNYISEDPITYKSVEVGDLLYSDVFKGNYATCLNKKIEWELTPLSNEHISWELIQVVDSYGEVYWLELHKAKDFIYKTYHPTTQAPINALEK